MTSRILQCTLGWEKASECHWFPGSRRSVRASCCFPKWFNTAFRSSLPPTFGLESCRSRASERECRGGGGRGECRSAAAGRNFVGRSEGKDGKETILMKKERIGEELRKGGLMFNIFWHSGNKCILANSWLWSSLEDLMIRVELGRDKNNPGIICTVVRLLGSQSHAFRMRVIEV